jgi:hypothetical protein
MRKSLTSVAVAVAAAGLLAIPGAAQAANPKPLPTALANHPFATEKSGQEIFGYGPGANNPGNCQANTSELSFDGANAVLTTSGQAGDCTDLESVHTYPTSNGYVYESRVYFSNWTQWDSFWMYGNNWPTDGEIDSVEGGSGTSFMSYHYGNPGSYSTCNNSNGCDANATPLQDGPDSANVAPGWHTIDISFGQHGAGQGQVAVWYDGALYGQVWGTNVLNGGNQNDPYWFTWGTGSCDSASNGNICNGTFPDPGTVKVAWIRIFT